jgi:ribosomal-protein-alanine N-acetyltransferase
MNDAFCLVQNASFLFTAGPHPGSELLVTIFTKWIIFPIHVFLNNRMLNLQFRPFPTLTTQRLIMRELTLDDTEAVFEFRSNAEAMRYIGKPKATSLEDSRELIIRMIDGLNSNDSLSWGITLAGNNKVIGTVGFWRIQKEHYRAEIGYMLHPDHWNKGIITEAVEAAMTCGFEQLGFHSIEAQLTPENIGSVRILEKTGFAKEAHLKENYFYDGVFSDTAIYSILNPKG